jgi:hypothetical protein
MTVFFYYFYYKYIIKLFIYKKLKKIMYILCIEFCITTEASSITS